MGELGYGIAMGYDGCGKVLRIQNGIARVSSRVWTNGELCNFWTTHHWIWHWGIPCKKTCVGIPETHRGLTNENMYVNVVCYLVVFSFCCCCCCWHQLQHQIKSSQIKSFQQARSGENPSWKLWLKQVPQNSLGTVPFPWNALGMWS